MEFVDVGLLGAPEADASDASYRYERSLSRADLPLPTAVAVRPSPRCADGGRGLFATVPLAAGAEALRETPICRLQDLGNRQDVLTCGGCLALLGDAESCLALLGRRSSRADVVGAPSRPTIRTCTTLSRTPGRNWNSTSETAPPSRSSAST